MDLWYGGLSVMRANQSIGETRMSESAKLIHFFSFFVEERRVKLALKVDMYSIYNYLQ